MKILKNSPKWGEVEILIDGQLIHELKLGGGNDITFRDKGNVALIDARPYSPKFAAGFGAWNLASGGFSPISSSLGAGALQIAIDPTDELLAVVPDGGDLGLVVYDTKTWKPLWTIKRSGETSPTVEWTDSSELLVYDPPSSNYITKYDASSGVTKGKIDISKTIETTDQVWRVYRAPDDQVAVPMSTGFEIYQTNGGDKSRRIGNLYTAHYGSDQKNAVDQLEMWSQNKRFTLNVRDGDVVTTNRMDTTHSELFAVRGGGKSIKTSVGKGTYI